MSLDKFILTIGIEFIYIKEPLSNKNDSKIKFKLPVIDLLKKPTKSERENSNKNDA